MESDDDAIDDLFDRRGYPLAWRGQIGDRVRERPAHAESRSASAHRQLPWRQALQGVGTPTRVAGAIHPGGITAQGAGVAPASRPDALDGLPFAVQRVRGPQARARRPSLAPTDLGDTRRIDRQPRGDCGVRGTGTGHAQPRVLRAPTDLQRHVPGRGRAPRRLRYDQSTTFTDEFGHPVLEQGSLLREERSRVRERWGSFEPRT